MDSETRERVVNSLLEWHASNRRSFPWRETSDTYEVFVAEIFLQRTPAERVAEFYGAFLERYPTPCSLARADVDELKQFSAPLGLTKRMQWLKDSAKIICEKYGGQVPEDEEELRSLPGVGEYTASAILVFGFGRDMPMVDVNVVRVISRVFDVEEDSRTKQLRTVRRIVKDLIPKGLGPSFNEGLLDIAAKVCKSNPICEVCPLNEPCAHIQR